MPMYNVCGGEQLSDNNNLPTPPPGTYYDKSGYLKDKETGKFVKGTKPGPMVEMRKETGRGATTKSLAKAIKDAFEVRVDTVDTLDENNRIRRKRKAIMADALAQIITTGEVYLPGSFDRRGRLRPGKHFEFSADEWLSNLIKLLRYIEPPVTEIGLSEGTKGIIFDMPVKRKGDDDDDDDIVVQNVQPAQITDASYETIEEDEEQEE